MLQFKQNLKEISTALLDIAAPRRCMRCSIEGTWLCPQCITEVVRDPKLSCIVCEIPHPRGATCIPCRQLSPVRSLIHGAPYDAPWIRAGISWLKFRGITDIAPTLASLIAPKLLNIAPLATLRSEYVLVPMALHAKRRRARGFNQSELIARALQEQTGISVQNALVRIRNTPSQARLPKQLRDQNVADAFSLNETPIKENVIIIDDVATSGATLTQAARPFSSAKYKVFSAVIAKG